MLIFFTVEAAGVTWPHYTPLGDHTQGVAKYLAVLNTTSADKVWRVHHNAYVKELAPFKIRYFHKTESPSVSQAINKHLLLCPSIQYSF